MEKIKVDKSYKIQIIMIFLIDWVLMYKIFELFNYYSIKLEGKNIFVPIYLITFMNFIISLLVYKNIKVSKKRKGTIFESYKYDINRRFKHFIWIINIIKFCVILFLIRNVGRFERLIIIQPIVFICVDMFSTFYNHSFFEFRKFQLNSLRKMLENKDGPKLNIIIYKDENNIITSSFDLEHYQPSTYKYNFYIDLDKDMPEILKLYPDAHEKLWYYKRCYINTVSKNTEKTYEEELYDFRLRYGLEGNNNVLTYELLVYEDIRDFEKPTDLDYIEFLNVCDSRVYADKVAEVLNRDRSEEEYDEESKLNIKRRWGLSRYGEIDKELANSYFKSYYKLRIFDDMKILMQEYAGVFGGFYTFPKITLLYELYKSAILNKSAYEATLIFLNYAKVILQIIAYYYFIKNHKDDENFNPNKINRELLVEGYDKLGEIILDNVTENDSIYDNVKNKEWPVDASFEFILKNRIEPLLELNIKREKITFYGLCDVLQYVRNKVQSHGNISNDRLYDVWILVFVIISYLTEILKLTDLDIDINGKKIGLKYDENDFLYMGNYIIWIDGFMNIVQSQNKDADSYQYINYFKGEHSKPEEIEIPESELEE